MLYAGGFLRYAPVMMCDVCGDVVRITEWTQLTLDEDHELWFTLAECMCGTRIWEAKAVQDVHA